MSFLEWLLALLSGRPLQPYPDPAKVTLTARQLEVAERLAEMKGVTRDDVLAEAYRRADRILRR